jgi:hypothetical protein
VGGCQFDTECPVFFRCARIDAFHGACVRRTP